MPYDLTLYSQRAEGICTWTLRNHYYIDSHHLASVISPSTYRSVTFSFHIAPYFGIPPHKFQSSQANSREMQKYVPSLKEFSPSF